MAKTKWRTHWNYTFKPQTKFGKSLTVPDQNMSVVEIMKRYASGRSLKGNAGTPIYDEGVDPFNGVDPRSLDISERADIMRDVKDRIDEANKLTAEINAKAQEKAKKDAWIKEHQEAQQKQEPKPSEATSGPSAANPKS